MALGYLLNRNMLRHDDIGTEVEYDGDLDVVVTAFGDLLEAVEGARDLAFVEEELARSKDGRDDS